MRYRIGEMAEFFGMSKEGVRFLERQGVIHAMRDEKNGYRYFPREEITSLKQIRRYQSLGFSLEEAQQMVCDTPREEIAARLSQKQEELARKAQQIQTMQKQLALQQEAVRHLLDCEQRIWEGERPEMYFFPRVPDEASGTTAKEKEAIARAREEEKQWILAAPPCVLGAMHLAADGSGRRVMGSIVRAQSAREVGLAISERVIHLPPCFCVCGVVDAPLYQKPDLAPLLDYGRAKGWSLSGDVYGVLWMTYCDEAGDRWGIHEMYVPMEKKCRNDLTVK